MALTASQMVLELYTYDRNGNRLIYSFSRTIGGLGDLVNTMTIRTFTYDDNGNELKNSFDKNGDGIANTITTYTYDGNGNQLTKKSYEGDVGDTLDRSITYTWAELSELKE